MKKTGPAHAMRPRHWALKNTAQKTWFLF